MNQLSLLLIMLASILGSFTQCLGQTDEFHIIAPRSNMLGMSVSNLSSGNGGITTFSMHPANALDRGAIVDSIVQVGPDSASIQARMQTSLNLTFLRNRRSYVLKIYPSNIRIIYLGPKTLTGIAVGQNQFVAGVIVAQSIKIQLEQAQANQINYKWLLDEARRQITRTQPALGAILNLVQIDSAKAGRGHNVVARWAATNKNLVYGISTIRIANTNPTVYSKPFEAAETYTLTVNKDDHTGPAASEYGGIGLGIGTKAGYKYKLCYEYLIDNPTPQLVVRLYDSDSRDLPVLIVPRKIGRSGPIWHGNYLLKREPRGNSAVQLVYLAVDAKLSDPKDSETVTINQGSFPWQTGISYPVYEFTTR